MDVRHESFLAAIAIPRFCIGKRLEAYSIGHQIALKATDNAFVRDLHLPVQFRETPTFPDLIEAAFICSRTFEQGQKEKASKLLPLKMRAWGRRAGRFDIVAEILQFRQLVIDANEQPDINRNVSATTRAPVSPWENRLRIWLLTEGLAKTGSEAWNYPLRLALIDYATVGESKGEISFFSERDELMMRIAKGLESQVTE